MHVHPLSLEDVSTLVKTLRRKSGVTYGDNSGYDSFDPPEKYYGVGIDNFSGSGWHH
jgi:hypothetical protein